MTFALLPNLIKMITKKNVLLIKLLELSCFLLIGFFVYSCEKTEDKFEKAYPGVDEELWKYFQTFEVEGQARGYQIDLIDAGITGEITTIHSTFNNSFAGLCNAAKSHKAILIDNSFWDRSNEMSRELVVFHELGHCYLGLNHSTNLPSGGFCKSIMRPGNGNCLDRYDSSTREQLIDELFSQ